MITRHYIILFISVFGWLVLGHVESFGSNTKLLDKLGILGNVNRPEIWEDQLGGYMTGGSIHASVPVSNLELVTLDPPSFNAGCGGINAYFGGFGYINGRQLEELFKNIGSNALSFGTMLTMKTLSPLISDLLENLEAMARFMNSQNINSCQMGASIASGLFPKNEHAQRLACQARKMGGASGVGAAASNYFTARYDCSDGLQMRATNSGKGDSMLPLEYNLVWLALSKEGVSLSLEDKEFLMGLSGTVIARETSGGSLKLEHKKSLMLDNKLLHSLIFGSNLGSESLERYSCAEDDDCLSPVIVKSNMKPEDTMIFKVSRIIESIASKILSENAGSTEELQPEEKHLITKSSIHAGLKGHGVSHTVEDYAESIAFDYVIGYLDSLLNFVYQALGSMEHAQMEGDQIKSFKEEIRYIKQMLFNERVKAFERLNTQSSALSRSKTWFLHHLLSIEAQESKNMSVLDTVYSYGSGKVLFHCFNAIAMMFRSGLIESLIDLSLVLSLAFVGFQAAFGKDKTGIYVRWFMTYLVVVLALVQPRSIFQDGGMTIHIRDIITKKAYKVDHLPPGLVLPASVISGLGFALAQSFEQVFSHDDPTYLPYHRYGTLFGSQVMSELRNFKIQDPVFAENMEGYISNCMMYDVMIGRKYDITELRNSTDIWKLITDNASNLRMFNYRYPGKGGRKLVTCKAGITEIASFFKGEESVLAKKFPIFSSVSSQNAKGGIIKSLELSSRFYDNLSVNGSDQLRQILLINAFKDTPASYGKLRGLQQQNSSWKFTGELAGITLPVMHSLFQAILYSVFPIIVGLVFFSERYSVLKRYFEMMVWIELWPILFAILNLIISVHSKSAGFSEITIGSIENITSTQSSYALAASSLSLMIPTFAYMIAKGGVSSFVHMAGSVMASSASGSSFASQEVISGNRSFDNVSGNNQSFNNLHSNKVNTSGELVSGHMRQSLADGTMQTDFLHMPSASSRIFQGGIGLSSSGGMTSINIGSHIQEGLQRQVQESSSIVASESQEISRIKQQMARHAIDYLASAGESESRGEHHSWNTSTREGEMMQSAMRQMKELHDNYNYSWHQSAERVLTTNFSAGLEFNKSVGSEAAASGKKSISVEGNAGGNMQWKNSNNSAQDISENKSVSSSDDVQNFIESVALASKDLNYSNSQSNEMRLSKDLNLSYEELKSHRENLALHTNKMHQAQESLDMSASNTASWNRSSYDDTLTFIANKLDPNKDYLERIGINRAREIIEQGGPELQSYVTELAGRKLQEMRMPNHYMMESRYDALSNHASSSAATIDSALQEKMENNIGLGNMANDFGYLEEQGKNKLSGSDIQKSRDNLADRAAGIVESKIDSIGKTGHALKEEVNKAEKERSFKETIGRENKNDGSWS